MDSAVTPDHTARRPRHWFSALASALDPRSAPRLALLLLGAILARLYVREKNLIGIAPRYRPPFRTKLELAVDLMRWAVRWLGFLGKSVWVVADGAYATAPFLKPMRSLAVTVVSRLRKDAALWV